MCYWIGRKLDIADHVLNTNYPEDMFMTGCVQLCMELSYYPVWAPILKISNEKRTF
jgi:hypothetical protein